MRKIAYIYDPVFLEHDTGNRHPERIERLVAINNHLDTNGINDELTQISPKPATETELSLIHSSTYLSWLEEAFSNGRELLDGGDTVVSARSLEAATLAAGAAMEAVDGMLDGKITRAFCAVRPPGHHAEKDRAMGFCIFNNIAIGARYAQHVGLANRVLIVDWDVHHGNGTQHIFDRDNTVFYYSIHQFPYYPGTGSSEEKGLGEGEGFTLNRPLAIGSGDDVYLSSFEKDIQAVLDIFKPELIMISAGFDAHKDDPLAGMQVTQSGFFEMTKILTDISRQYCQGRIISMLEGGYNLQALANSVEKHLQAMMES